MKRTYAVLLFGLLECVLFFSGVDAQKPFRTDPQDPQAAEKEQVRRAVIEFEGRLLMRDLVSLTGELEEDRRREQAFVEIEMPKHPPAPSPSVRDSNETVGSAHPRRASKIVAEKDTSQAVAGSVGQADVQTRKVRVGRLTRPNRKFVTTSEQDYSVDQRKALREQMKAMFVHIPEDIRVHLIPEQIEITATTATVQAVYYFRPRMGNADAARIPGFAKGEPESIQLRLRRLGDEWRVEDVKTITERLTISVPR